MIEKQGNIWTRYCQPNEFLCVTTNSTLNNKLELVMGAGVALEAKKRMPWLPYFLGPTAGGQEYNFRICPNNIIALQTKFHWKDPSPLDLIERSVRALSLQMRHYPNFIINMTRPGCGHGQLSWETQVKPICEDFLKGERWVIWYQ